MSDKGVCADIYSITHVQMEVVLHLKSLHMHTYLCTRFEILHLILYPQGDEGDNPGVHHHTGCDTPPAVFGRYLCHIW